MRTTQASSVAECESARGKSVTQASYHCDNTADKVEVLEVLGVDTRARVDLKSVVVAGVLEQTIHRVENLMRQQEEVLPMESQSDIRL